MLLDDLRGQRGSVLSSGPSAHSVRNDHHAPIVIQKEGVLVLGSPESRIGDADGLPSECQKGSMP